MTGPVAQPEVRFRATGVEAVKRATRDVSQSAGQMQQRVGSASQQIASGLENIARQGKLTGEAMKQVASQAGQIAFMFGPQGAIAGAVAVLGVAMFSFWDRTRKEMEETRRKGIEELQKLADGSDLVGASRYQQHLYSGNPNALRMPGESDADFLRRRGGLQGVQSRLAGLRADPANTEAFRLAEAGSFVGSTSGIGKEIRALLKAEIELQSLYRQATPIVNALAEAEGRRAANLQRIEASAKGLKLLESDAKKNAELRLRVAQQGLGNGPGGGLAVSDPYVDADPRRFNRNFGQTASPALAHTASALIKKQLENSPALQALTEWAERMKGIAETRIGVILGEGIANGFARAFNGEGVAGVIKGFGQTVLGAIGGLFQQMGMAYLQFGKIMSWATALYNPATAGAAGIMLGIALMALGGALQGLASGGGGRGGGGFSSVSMAATSGIDRGLINPINPMVNGITPRANVTVPVTVVNPHDPATQRVLRETIKHAGQRGSL